MNSAPVETDAQKRLKELKEQNKGDIGFSIKYAAASLFSAGCLIAVGVVALAIIIAFFAILF